MGKLKMILALLAVCPLAVQAQGLPDEGKYYLISMKSDGSQFVAEMADGSLGVVAKSNDQRIFWQFEPTENENCYYVKNATTGRYIMPCSGAQQSRIYTQAEPVEYYLGTSGSNVRFTSTDCADYDDTSRSPNGLNQDGASSNIIVWKAGTANGRSWWTLTETEYLFETRKPKPHTDFMKQAQIYDNPCATASDIYIASLQLDASEGWTGLQYPAYGSVAAKPSSPYQIYVKSKAELDKAKPFNVDVRLSAVPQEGDSLYLYFDFDRDGDFEVCYKADTPAQEMSFSVTAPEDAKPGRSRMRVRLTNNGLPYADDETCGQAIDFSITLVEVVPSGVELVGAGSEVQIRMDGQRLSVQAGEPVTRVSLYSLSGALVATAGGSNLSLADTVPGAYVVTFQTASLPQGASAKVLIK